MPGSVFSESPRDQYCGLAVCPPSERNRLSHHQPQSDAHPMSQEGYALLAAATEVHWGLPEEIIPWRGG